MFNFKELIGWMILVAWTTLLVWPLSYWYEIGEVYIPDIVHGERLEILYDGVVKRPVNVSYSVIIREVSTDAVVDEDHSGIFEYQPKSQRPNPITMEWWAPGAEIGHDLPPGNYTITTCWTAHNIFYGVVPTKSDCTKSNIFTVFPKELP